MKVRFLLASPSCPQKRDHTLAKRVEDVITVAAVEFGCWNLQHLTSQSKRKMTLVSESVDTILLPSFSGLRPPTFNRKITSSNLVGSTTCLKDLYAFENCQVSISDFSGLKEFAS